jgi:hypothetical protein
MIRYIAEPRGDTLVLHDTETGAKGSYRLEDGAFKLGELRVDLNDPKVLDQLMWSVAPRPGKNAPFDPTRGEVV